MSSSRPHATNSSNGSSGQIERWNCPTSSTLPRRPMQRQVSGRWSSSKDFNSPSPPSLPRRPTHGKSTPSRWSSSPTIGVDLGLPERPGRSPRKQHSADNLCIDIGMRVPIRRELSGPHMPRDRRHAFTRSASIDSLLSRGKLCVNSEHDESESSVYELPPSQNSFRSVRSGREGAIKEFNQSLNSIISLSNESVSNESVSIVSGSNVSDSNESIISDVLRVSCDRNAVFTRSVSDNSLQISRGSQGKLSVSSVDDESESFTYGPPPRQNSGRADYSERRGLIKRSTSSNSNNGINSLSQISMSQISMNNDSIISNISISSTECFAYEPPRASLSVNHSMSEMIRAGSFRAIREGSFRSITSKKSPKSDSQKVVRDQLVETKSNSSTKSITKPHEAQRPAFVKAASYSLLRGSKHTPNSSPNEVLRGRGMKAKSNISLKSIMKPQEGQVPALAAAAAATLLTGSREMRQSSTI